MASKKKLATKSVTLSRSTFTLYIVGIIFIPIFAFFLGSKNFDNRSRAAKTVIPNKAIQLQLSNSNAVYVPPVNNNTKITGSFTIEAWVKPIMPPGGTYHPPLILCKTATYPNLTIPFCLQLGVIQSQFRPYFTTDANSRQYSLTSNINMNHGTWYHVAVSVDATAGVIRMYVDGRSAGVLNVGQPLVFSDPNLGFVIGAMGHAEQGTVVEHYGVHFDGLLDEVRISNNARYTTDFSPQRVFQAADKNTMALYKFEDNANDSKRNNHGIVIGEVTYQIP
jgi:hypothetical protein